MSHEEQQQHEAIFDIGVKVTNIYKAGKILLPVFLGAVAFLGWFGVRVVSLYEWNNSLVKQPQLTAEKNIRAKADSVLTARTDTLFSILKPTIMPYKRNIPHDNNFGSVALN